MNTRWDCSAFGVSTRLSLGVTAILATWRCRHSLLDAHASYVSCRLVATVAFVRRELIANRIIVAVFAAAPRRLGVGWRSVAFGISDALADGNNSVRYASAVVLFHPSAWNLFTVPSNLVASGRSLLIFAPADSAPLSAQFVAAYIALGCLRSSWQPALLPGRFTTTLSTAPERSPRRISVGRAGPAENLGRELPHFVLRGLVVLPGNSACWFRSSAFQVTRFGPLSTQRFAGRRSIEKDGPAFQDAVSHDDSSQADGGRQYSATPSLVTQLMIIVPGVAPILIKL